MHSFLPADIANALVSGGLAGYVTYDLTHYYLHHAVPKNTYLRALKTYHLNHHYRNYHLGFGVSSKVSLLPPPPSSSFPAIITVSN